MNWKLIGNIIGFLLVIILGVFIFGDSFQKQLTNVMNDIGQVDEIVVDGTTVFEREQAKPYVEKNPVSFIMELSKKERKQFVNAPLYEIEYRIDGKKLYDVHILQWGGDEEEWQQWIAQHHLDDTIVSTYSFRKDGRPVVIYWPKNRYILWADTEATERLLEQLDG